MKDNLESLREHLDGGRADKRACTSCPGRAPSPGSASASTTPTNSGLAQRKTPPVNRAHPPGRGRLRRGGCDHPLPLPCGRCLASSPPCQFCRSPMSVPRWRSTSRCSGSPSWWARTAWDSPSWCGTRSRCTSGSQTAAPPGRDAPGWFGLVSPVRRGGAGAPPALRAAVRRAPPSAAPDHGLGNAGVRSVRPRREPRHPLRAGNPAPECRISRFDLATGRGVCDDLDPSRAAGAGLLIAENHGAEPILAGVPGPPGTGSRWLAKRPWMRSGRARTSGCQLPTRSAPAASQSASLGASVDVPPGGTREDDSHDRR